MFKSSVRDANTSWLGQTFQLKSKGARYSGGLILIHNTIKYEGSRFYFNYKCFRYSFAVMRALSMNDQGDRVIGAIW